MNRIYQGRVSRIETLDPESGEVSSALEGRDLADQSASPLWKHHEIFQDAVNYYLLSLAALAQGAGESAHERLGKDLLERVGEAWERFPKSVSGSVQPQSLRQSVGGWLGLDGDATLKDAFAKVLGENDSKPALLRLALSLLLERCEGDSGIQQGGRGYFPRLCDSACDPTYDYSKEAIRSASGKSELAEVLHSDPGASSLQDLAGRMDLSWTVKLQPGKKYTPAESKERLGEAINHLLGMAEKPSLQQKEVFARFPEYREELGRHLEEIARLPDDLEIPRNRKANKSLTFATLAFQHFPTRLTAEILKLFVKKPSGKKKKEEKKEQPDYTRFNDDPIKLARGKRGYIFRAFTALPAWNPERHGTPTWKEFDIAAFKEALKSLNQFNQKTEEREEKKKNLEGKIAILLGSDPPEGWKPKKTDGEETEERPEPLDTELFTLARRLESQLSTQLADTVLGNEKTECFGEAEMPFREGEWQVSGSSLRGFRDIAPKWNKLHKEKGGTPSRVDLEEVVKDYQRDESNKRAIGSLPLFLALCEEDYWPLWLKGGDDEAYNRFLFKMASFHQTVRDYHRSTEAINLTPAEPRHSRRLYMFSDIGGKEKVVFKEDGVLETTIVERSGKTCSKRRVRIYYAAPRLNRDELLGGGESRWLQPMTKALGLEMPEPEPSFQSAVSLMPDFTRESELRLLLNFAKTIDASWIHEQLGKASVWNGQFNGIKGKNLHLHWPDTAATKPSKENPWWKNKEILKNGFTLHSVDLGQRTAGAWSLLKVTAWDPRQKNGGTRRPVRPIGHDGKREWFAEILKTGMHRLPGEDQKVRDKEGKMNRELAGKAGRNADSLEYDEGKQLAKALGAETPENWVGQNHDERSFPEQNDALLALSNRRLSRLNTFHRWSCLDRRIKEQPDQKDRLLKALGKELEHWQDQEVADWKQVFENKGVEAFCLRAGERFLSYRTELEGHFLTLAHRVAPLRGKKWVWQTRPKKKEDDPAYGELLWEPTPDRKSPKVRGQRGLSIARLEQLETLRKIFLRFNRSFDKQPGKLSKVGFGFTRESGEPCQLLLGKIDRMKEQRVNQTAHLILAQALGVRLKVHSIDTQERASRDIHGEYERIPGREPVDFIVIENLDRYLTSQGRAPSENRRLMKWAHRAVRDKIKMLAEEPFGIPVVEAPAAYSSRFSAVDSQSGSRCEERATLDQYLRDLLKKKSEASPKDKSNDPRPHYLALIRQFETLEKENEVRKVSKKNPRALLLEKPGGPLFLPAASGPVVQADANAASNIGLRALASPDSLHLLHKVRTEKRNDQFSSKKNNVREKAAFKDDPAIRPEGTLWKKTQNSDAPNFFFDEERVSGFDHAHVTVITCDGEKEIPLTSGVAVWSATRQKTLERIVELNNQRLEGWKMKPVSVPAGTANDADPDDDIPMEYP